MTAASIYQLILSTYHQFSCSVLSDSLQPRGLQHTRFSCPSPTPGAYSNSCPLSRCCSPWDHQESDVTEQLNCSKCLLKYHFPHPLLFFFLSLCLCFCLSFDLTNYSLKKWVVSPFSHHLDFSHYLPEVLFYAYSTLLLVFSENESKCSINFRFELLEKQKSYHIW